MEFLREKIFLAAAILYASLMLLEWWRSLKHRPAAYSAGDTLVNIAAGLGSILASRLFLVVVVFVFAWASRFAVFEVPATGWAFCLLFLGYDFCHYWAHRFGHRTHIGWAAHVTHHSSEHYNFSVAVRQSWTQTLYFPIFLPLALVGFPFEYVILVQPLVGLWQFWLHTEAIGKLPRWFEAVFTTPSQHRVHHASDEKYLDKNYGGVLSIWDRLFGTYQPEEAHPTYGLTTNIRTHNLLYVQFHVWVDVFRNLARAKGIPMAFRAVFAPPGEQPDYPLRPVRWYFIRPLRALLFLLFDRHRPAL